MAGSIVELRKQLTRGPAAELRRLLDDPALQARLPDSQDPQQAAERAVTALRCLGQCLLFAAEPGTFPERVGVHVLRRAVPRACEQMRGWKQAAAELGRLWDEEGDLRRLEEVTLQRVEERLDAEAICVGAAESAAAAMRAGEITCEEADALLEQLQEELDSWDAELLEHLDLLSVVADEPIVTGWQQALADAYRETPPWLLSGILQERAEVSRQEVENDPLLQPLATPAEAQRPSRAPSQRAYPPRLLTVQMAAAPATRNVLLRWNAPGGNHYAFASLGVPVGETRELEVRVFRTEDDREAHDLAGRPVTLAGVAGTIDAGGVCRFSVDELRRAAEQGQPLELQVGGESWPADEQSLAGVERTLLQLGGSAND